MDTPAITDFPDEMDRLAEWRRRRAAEEERNLVAAALSREHAERTGAEDTLLRREP